MNSTRGLSLPCLLAVGAVLLLATHPASAARTGSPASSSPVEQPELARYHEQAVLHGGTTSSLSKAATDSFNIYGGVRQDGSNDRRPEGQFQDFLLFPVDQGWFGVDRTENPTYWHISTFNAENFAGGVGNNAMWSGVEAGAPGFTSAPGYGNNWNDVLLWEALANPAQNTQVRLQLDFNHDTEPGYDYFHVEYDSSGVWVPLATYTGTNKDASGNFLAPVSFDQTVLYTPFMYTGPQNASVRLRLRVSSDGAWSDEDGLWPTRGAAQVDDIQVSFNGNPISPTGDDGTATFEDLGGSFDNDGWNPVSATFAGDFAHVIPQLRDIDPCRDDLTPQLAFVDDGTPPSNSSISTGGTTSLNWSYGVRDGWVVNYNGGVSFGEVPLNNEFWSPEIAWDDTSSTEDDNLLAGAFMRYTVWQHLPLDNGLFWTWSVRSEVNGNWSSWQNRNFVYYGGGVANYISVQNDVTDLLQPDPDHVQIALGVIDLAETFALIGNDATPSPMFDNVSFWRYDRGGPAFTTRNIDLFQGGFPNGGSIDALSAPADLSVRIDMARDVSTGTANVPGDSIVVDVTATIPGSSLSGLPEMKWVLEANPLFDAVRSVPAGATSLGPGARGWDRWMGTVTGDSARTGNGVAVADRFFFDAPNDGPAHASAAYQTGEPAMFFPGDRFRYFIESTDDLGNTSSLPADTTGFMGSGSYNRVFTVRALPSIVDDGGGGTIQPEILVINDFGHRGGEASFLSAFGQNGLFEDTDFDVYTVKGPSSLVGNGIGSAGSHGANAQQLRDYDVLLYLSGNLSDGLISDGTNANGNSKSPDTETLTQWHGLAGDRYAVYFGDDLCSFLNRSGAAGGTYLSTILSVDPQDNDVRDDLNGQAVSLVQAAGTAGGIFAQEYVAFGGCLGINQFDNIQPQGASVATHEFISNLTGLPFSPAASVWHERVQNVGGVDYTRVDMTFPYGFSYVYDPIGKASAGPSKRSLLLKEILEAFGKSTNPGAVTGNAPLPSQLVVERNLPNPFNPTTTIRFRAPANGEVRVRIYNLRGELVRQLFDEKVEAGAHQVVWNGTDDRGATVASGVYVYEVAGFGERVTKKMALVK